MYIIDPYSCNYIQSRSISILFLCNILDNDIYLLGTIEIILTLFMILLMIVQGTRVHWYNEGF